jgi:hypothetical protein
LCFKCGAKYDPSHECPKQAAAELHAMHTEDISDILSDEILQLIEMQDLA